jgi:hypothetical protein
MSEANGTKKSNTRTWEYLLNITAAPEVLKSIMESFDDRLTEFGIPHTLALRPASNDNPSTTEYEALKNASDLFVGQDVTNGTYAVVFPKVRQNMQQDGNGFGIDDSDILARGFATRSAAWDYAAEKFPGIPRPESFDIIEELSKVPDGGSLIVRAPVSDSFKGVGPHHGE